jgi:uncharacterized membrane protein YfcA
MHPRVAERTSNLMAGIICSASATNALFYGNLPTDYGIVFSVMAAIGFLKGNQLRD